MKVLILALLAGSLSAVHIDVYGDISEIDKETVQEAREYLTGKCFRNLNISGLDFYSNMRMINPRNFKLAIEDTACVLDDTFIPRSMECQAGDKTGATVTYVKGAVCRLGGEIQNIIASHIPTQKMTKLEKFIEHLETAIDVFTKVCSRKVHPYCKPETDGLRKLRGGTETPHVNRRKSIRRQNPRNGKSDARDDNNFMRPSNDGFSDTTPTTTMTTQMMEHNETTYFYDDLSIDETTIDPEKNDETDGDGNNGHDTKEAVFDKIQKISGNLAEIATGLAESESEISTEEIITLACVSLACLLLIVNIMIQYVRRRSNSVENLSRNIVNLRAANEALIEGLWPSTTTRRNV